MSIQAMKQALEALQIIKRYGNVFAYKEFEENPHQLVCDAIIALRAAIEAAEKQEPELWIKKTDESDIWYSAPTNPHAYTPLYTHPQPAIPAGIFKIDDRVTKIKGSRWTGKVVGTYSTTLTPEGYAVESETEIGSVQIYPAAALEIAPKPEKM